MGLRKKLPKLDRRSDRELDLEFEVWRLKRENEKLRTALSDLTQMDEYMYWQFENDLMENQETEEM